MKYYANEINQYKESCGIQKTTMLGAIRDLEVLKKFIEENYTRFDYLSYDIEYHGWTGEHAKNIHNIRDLIIIKLNELYAICLAGLGEEMKCE